MKDKILQKEYSEKVCYTDEVSPREWVELTEKLVTAIHELENELEELNYKLNESNSPNL